MTDFLLQLVLLLGLALLFAAIAWIDWLDEQAAAPWLTPTEPEDFKDPTNDFHPQLEEFHHEK